MSVNNRNMSESKRMKVRISLWGLTAVLFISSFIILTSFSQVLGLFLLALLFAILVYLIYTSRKYYNWLLPLFLLFFAGFIFKRNYWPGGGVIFTVSSTMIAIHLYIFATRVFIIFKNKSFLKWLGFASSLVLAVVMLTFLFRIQHWPLPIPFSILNQILSLSLIVIAFIIIIKLPNINFVSWLPIDRKIFYRVILLPLTIVFFLTILLNVFPNMSARLFSKEIDHPWHFQQVEIKKLEGID